MPEHGGVIEWVDAIVIEMVATHDATKHTNGAVWHGPWNGMDMLSRPECAHVDATN